MSQVNGKFCSFSQKLSPVIANDSNVFPFNGDSVLLKKFRLIGLYYHIKSTTIQRDDLHISCRTASSGQNIIFTFHISPVLGSIATVTQVLLLENDFKNLVFRTSATYLVFGPFVSSHLSKLCTDISGHHCNSKK